MNFKNLSIKLISTLSRYKSILICIKGSPDPDVIASSYALKLICDIIGIKAIIAGIVKPSLPQNSAIIEELDIPISFVDKFEDFLNYDTYAVLDYQLAHIDGITGKIPCVLHIDHHEAIEEDIEIDFKLVVDEAGSISSFFALMIRELAEPERQGVTLDEENVLDSGIEVVNKDVPVPPEEGAIAGSGRFNSDLLRKAATALLFGIYTDTDAYRHATKIDFEALGYISKYFDKRIIDRITVIPLPDHVLNLLLQAIENKVEYKNWIFAGVGFVDESERDSIALIADFIIQRFTCSVVIVYGAIVKKKYPGLRLDASFRTEDEDIDLDGLIKHITSTGGGRKYKGAYQVDLNYFADCPDKDMLWKVIRSSTEAKLKDLRDEFQLIEIKGLYKRIKKKAGMILNIKK